MRIKRYGKYDFGMGPLPCLREQNEVADTERYGTEKLSSLLSKVQTGKFDRRKEFTGNSD